MMLGKWLSLFTGFILIYWSFTFVAYIPLTSKWFEKSENTVNIDIVVAYRVQQWYLYTRVNSKSDWNPMWEQQRSLKWGQGNWHGDLGTSTTAFLFILGLTDAIMLHVIKHLLLCTSEHTIPFNPLHTLQAAWGLFQYR